MVTWSKPVLEIEGLVVSYGALTALQGVSLTVGSGEIVVLVGPNGAGKSTLLKAVAGLLHPRSGAIRWEGEELSAIPPHRIVERGLALVPEGRRLFARMTIRENLELGAFTPRAQAEKSRRLDRVYEIFPRLQERQDQLAGSLSGGEQQMLALGRAFMSAPRLLLLDEPSLGLAPRVAEAIFSVLGEFHREGLSIFLVEQNVQAALTLAQRAYILEGGKIVGAGEGRSLLQDEHIRTAYLGPLARGGQSN
ncbi:MAG: ABC transporter ATP-binding protein [Candidatus Tectomicrobia bacterium]|uniref:ABC transporter ATP-binding protein n=1 Tax=Tectimicrobiota bacterium TaxID=2528274 RepID=A0A932M115_UNCTE|nr:ABC transporter ATP-binding protein [Candidatus Tectomicrobia bacterium]